MNIVKWIFFSMGGTESDAVSIRGKCLLRCHEWMIVLTVFSFRFS